MKKTTRIKLALDIVMLSILLLMYHKNVLGMSFHEIGGLAVCGLFSIHILLNGKWVRVISGKLFSRKIAWRNKLNWLVDFLLLLCFIYIVISGIHISRVLFDGQRGPSVFKTGHYAVSALALLLVGLHIGLHYACIISCTPARRVPLAMRRITAVVMSVLILGFGVYQMTETSFLHWISNLGAVIGTTDEITESDTLSHSDSTETAVAAAAPDTAPVDLEEGRGHGNGRGNGGEGKGNGNGGNLTADPSVIAPLLLNFLTITLAFSVVVAWIDGALLKRKKRRRLQCDLPV